MEIVRLDKTASVGEFALGTKPIRQATDAERSIASRGTTKTLKASIPDVKRPAEVTLIAIYYAAFSVVLLGVLARQMLTHSPSAGWAAAALPLLFCVLIAVIPGVIALGLWILDDAARIGSVILALVHAVVTILWRSRIPGGHLSLPLVRLVIDCAIVLCMMRPRVQRAFKWRPTELRLP